LPTKIALKRYEEISKCLEKAAKASWSDRTWLHKQKALKRAFLLDK
jgi:hypothetical protein